MLMQCLGACSTPIKKQKKKNMRRRVLGSSTFLSFYFSLLLALFLSRLRLFYRCLSCCGLTFIWQRSLVERVPMPRTHRDYTLYIHLSHINNCIAKTCPGLYSGALRFWVHRARWSRAFLRRSHVIAGGPKGLFNVGYRGSFASENLRWIFSWFLPFFSSYFSSFLSLSFPLNFTSYLVAPFSPEDTWSLHCFFLH